MTYTRIGQDAPAAGTCLPEQIALRDATGALVCLDAATACGETMQWNPTAKMCECLPRHQPTGQGVCVPSKASTTIGSPTVLGWTLVAAVIGGVGWAVGNVIGARVVSRSKPNQRRRRASRNGSSIARAEQELLRRCEQRVWTLEAQVENLESRLARRR